MTEKTRNILITLSAALVLAIITFLAGRCTAPQPEESIVIKTDTITKRIIDTIYVDTIIYKYKRITDTLYIPADTALLVEEKTYEDSISTIVIEGVNPELKSVEYRLPKDCVIINNETTITKIEEVRSGWGITIGGYVGYGGYIQNGQVNVAPEIGIGGCIGWTYIFKHRKKVQNGIKDTNLK